MKYRDIEGADVKLANTRLEQLRNYDLESYAAARGADRLAQFNLKNYTDGINHQNLHRNDLYLRKHAMKLAGLETLVRNRVDDVEMSRKAISKMRDKGNFEYVARNARGAIRSCLAMSCLVLRGQNDPEGARQAIHTVLEFVPAILEAVDAVQASGRTEENFVHCGNFRHVIVALFIAQQWDLAKTLGEAILLDAVVEEAEQGSANDIDPKMFAALARKDRDGFNREHQRFKRALDDDDYYYRTYFSIYEPLMEAIANQDSGVDFDAGLRAAEARYLKRAKDKIYDHTTEILDGGKLVAGHSCDVYALGLANLARHRGFRVSYNSSVIPTNVFAEPIK